MDDQNFFSIYDMLNNNSTYNDIIAVLDYEKGNEEIFPPIYSVAERLFNKKEPVGSLISKIVANDNEQTIKKSLEIINRNFANGYINETGIFYLDYHYLNNQDVLNFLRQNYQRGNIKALNILGKNYLLDEQTYSQISYFDEIEVNNSNINNTNIKLNNKNYETLIGVNSDKNTELNFVIKDDLTNKELEEMIRLTNGLDKSVSKKINIRFYNPAKAVELVERLNNANLAKEVKINILGYPLTENQEMYEKLLPLGKERDIEVNYVCCHDLLKDYCNPPFIVENKYQSELEPGGKTKLETYTKMLKFVENFEHKVTAVDSNLEKTLTAYQFINNNYYYDAHSGQTKDYADTRDVDKIFDKDEIVCVGYANLLSIMCRRVGIPMFCYSAPGHKMNVARIVDKDANGNTTLDKICTFDLTNDCGIYTEKNGKKIKKENKDSYTFLGLDPEIWLHDSNTSFITLANSLAITKDDLKYELISKSPFQTAYDGPIYSANSYMYSMLHLMGYNYNPNTTNQNDLIATLQSENKIGSIPKDQIILAIRNMERRNNPQMTAEQFSNHMNDVMGRVAKSFTLTKRIFSNPTPSIIVNNNNLQKVKTYKDNPNTIFNKVDIASIDTKPIYYEEIKDLPNGGGINISNKEEPTNAVINNSNASKENPINNIKSNEEQPKFTEKDFSENYIAGTTIRMPRYRAYNESDTDYVAFLKNYYTYYFPNAEKSSPSGHRLTKNQIIQDLPYDSKMIQVFKTKGMTTEEIEISQAKITSRK